MGNRAGGDKSLEELPRDGMVTPEIAAQPLSSWYGPTLPQNDFTKAWSRQPSLIPRIIEAILLLRCTNNARYVDSA
jgi:hypothetical protein